MQSWRGKVAVALVVAGTLSACDAWAQESVSYGSIGGVVTDESGGVIVGAEVTARHTETNLTARTATDERGRFRFPYLRIGPYEVAVSRVGFADTRRSLTLVAGAAFELPLSLAAGVVSSAVTVSAGAVVIETARSQVAGTVSQDEARALPLAGRNLPELALMVPGVSLPNVGGGTQRFPETSAVPGVGLSIGSQRNLSNSFLVDGLSANDDAAALGGMVYAVDAVEQVQVVTSGGQAELGRALGGYMNVVTKSGTNVARGDMYFYGGHDRLNAESEISGRRVKLPTRQGLYGASLGGPVRRDRTFYFVNVEQKRLHQSGLVTVLPGNVEAINARLGAVGYRGPLVSTGIYASPIDASTAIGKLDHALGDGNHLSVRYSLYDAHAENARGAGALSMPSASSGLDNLDQTVAASHVTTISPRTVLETRAQAAFSDLQAPPSDAIGPNVTISGVGNFGTLSSSPTARRNTMVQAVSSLSRQAGVHAIRVGVDVLYNDLTITFPRARRGSYAFSSLANFLAGTYNNAGFTQTFGETVVSQTNPNLGVYAQDEWKVGPALTINLGLRYDLQFLETIDTDSNNVSPRIGVAWLPSEARRTVVRASAGVFYDRVPLRALANALLSAGNTTDLTALRQINVSLSPAQTGAPVFPAVLSDAVPSVTLVNLTTMDRELENAYSRQASVEVEQQVGATGTISIGYQALRGRKLIASVNQNVPTCLPAGSNNGCRPNPAYANDSRYSSVGQSQFDMLYVSIVQRPAAWGGYRLSYALSRSMNDVGEAFFSGPIDPADLSKDWGRSDGDQRHRLVVSGSLRTGESGAGGRWAALTRAFQITGVLQYSSALPFNITSGVTTLQGTPGRPVVDGQFIERNAGIGHDFLTVSLRLGRTFRPTARVRLEGLVEAFNVLNRRNILAVNGNFGAGSYPDAPSPTFRQVTAVGEPRAVQLGLRASF